MLEHWAEVLSAILLFVGFFIALVLQSPILHYIVILLAGALSGRIFYEKHRTQPIFPFILMVITFFVGYIIGALRANKILVMVFFIIGFGFSYWAHKKGHITFFKSEGFIR